MWHDSCVHVVYMYTWVHMYSYVDIYVYIHIYIYIYKYTYICVNLTFLCYKTLCPHYTYVYICIHVFICRHIHIYIYMCPHLIRLTFYMAQPWSDCMWHATWLHHVVYRIHVTCVWHVSWHASCQLHPWTFWLSMCASHSLIVCEIWLQHMVIWDTWHTSWRIRICDMWHDSSMLAFHIEFLCRHAKVCMVRSDMGHDSFEWHDLNVNMRTFYVHMKRHTHKNTHTLVTWLRLCTGRSLCV